MTDSNWPEGGVVEKLNNIVFETNHAPFGIAAYNPNSPVTDFVGRTRELATFREQISNVLHFKISRAIRLEGPAGVGKSTLFNYLKENIEKERRSTTATEYITKNHDIFSTYFQVPDRIADIKDIWKPMLDGLKAGFDAETGCEIGLPEYVAFKIIWKMYQNDRDAIANIIWPYAEQRPSNLHHVDFKNIINPILDDGTRFVSRIQEYYRNNKRKLRTVFKVTTEGETYEITRSDNKIITELFRVLDEDDPDDYLEQVNSASKNLFPKSDDVITFFNTLMRLYACSTGKQPLFLIGIDEVAKPGMEEKEMFFLNLAKLFVRLRNSLNYILFVFISTTEDWENYDEVINNSSDLKGQTDEFIHRMQLMQLEVSELIQVFMKRMNRFWENYSAYQSPLAPYYPFSESTFEYIYRYCRRNLRKSIHLLDKLWSQYRFKRAIPRLSTIFESMRAVRAYLNEPLATTTINRFELNIIRDAFTDPTRFNTNAKRSSAIEKGLENAWKCFLYEQPARVTRVENNPRIKTSTGDRRPDVLVELHGNRGAEYRRHIEFQVKAYGENASVDLEHIMSSLQLFKEHYTDFIYFVITGNGLKPNAEAAVKELENVYKARIRRPFIGRDKENYLFLLALYEEITGVALGSNPEDDLNFSKEILSKILGQDVTDFLIEIERLSYREPLINIEEDNSGIPVTPAPITPAPITPAPITPAPITPAPIQTTLLGNGGYKGNSWLEKYPQFNTFKYELCALCSYLETRERNTRYKNKFTINTVLKNVIKPNASLDENNFKNLVKHLSSSGFIQKEKSSFMLTPVGEKLYSAVKLCNFQVKV
ncbi:MAG: hypothetical protein ACTSU9_01815 [Promethearchaeota archaeon]